jgi:high potential iron-sulfur protein
MIDTSRVQSGGFSRRTVLLQGASCAAGVGALLIPARQAAAKMAPASVSYQETPKGDQQCDNCSLFQAPSACRIVDGTINPSGWCKFWAKKAG